MKIDDIWKNGEVPDRHQVDPKDDKKRKGWYQEIDVIKDKAEAMYRKLVDAGKVLDWNDNREDQILIKIHQGANFWVVDNPENRKIEEWFKKLELRRLQLSASLLADLQVRGPPYQYKKKKK